MIKIFNIPRGKILVFIQPSPWNKQTITKSGQKPDHQNLQLPKFLEVNWWWDEIILPARCSFNITGNSLNLSTRKCVAARRENYETDPEYTLFPCGLNRALVTLWYEPDVRWDVISCAWPNSHIRMLPSWEPEMSMRRKKIKHMSDSNSQTVIENDRSFCLNSQ